MDGGSLSSGTVINFVRAKRTRAGVEVFGTFFATAQRSGAIETLATTITLATRLETTRRDFRRGGIKPRREVETQTLGLVGTFEEIDYAKRPAGEGRRPFGWSLRLARQRGGKGSKARAAVEPTGTAGRFMV